MLYDSYNLLLKSIHNQLSALVIFMQFAVSPDWHSEQLLLALYTVGLPEDIGTDSAIMIEETIEQAPG